VVLSDSSDDGSALPDQPTGGNIDVSSSRDMEEEVSVDFVSQEHGVPRDGPKDLNAGG
jgi:hypothetical protein